MESKVFVSPGVYTSEKDITFITRQVGVTTLGLVGETTKGPAFQPIFINNYGEFQSFFGGLNATKVKDTGAPQYELPYIAKSYLSQSNQLFVTRVLGFSGYDAGQAWGITIDAAIDPSTTGSTTTSGSLNPLITYTASTAGTLTNIVSTDSLVTALLADSVAGPELRTKLAYLSTAATGSSVNISATFLKSGSSFTGASFNLYVKATNYTGGSSTVTGSTTGVTTYYSGSSYSGIDNKLVALLRSRGSIDFSTQLPSFEVSASTGVIFDPSYTAATADPLGIFSLSGKSTLQGLFNYQVTLDKTKRNYLPKVLARGAQDGKTALFVEELYGNLFSSLNADGKIRGIKQSLVTYGTTYSDYLNEFQPAVTPYIVSELRGTAVLRLFRFWTISDGNAANEQFKISIVNIKPDSKEFDVRIRGFYDTDAQPIILESFARCNMDPSSSNYIGRRIGTLDGIFASKSSYVLVEFDDTTDTSDAFPAGFIGYPIRNYQTNSNTSVVDPNLIYKQTYGQFENKRKYYLGLSETVGIDSDFFDYKGTPTTTTPNQWTGLTHGFHMDINASGVTIDNVTVVINNSGTTYNPIFLFDTGDAVFTTESSLLNGPYEKIYARKFTLVPYGGFDGWDIYNTRRTNTDSFLINGTYGAAGLTNGAFKSRTLTNGDLGINSDYYAYLEAIWTFRNPEAVNINVFATPGIDDFDNTNLVEATIEMIETDRADSLYIVTTPDTDGGGGVLSIFDVVDNLTDQFDSSYTCTYWPWVQINDAENNVLVFVPPTRDVVRNIALTDNISFPWFSVAGIQRGNVDAIQARVKLTQSDRDDLYENRINPIATFTSDGIKIWGNKTLQVKDTALNRINVRRLLLQARKLISAVSIRLLFEQNDSIVRNQFLALDLPMLRIDFYQ